MPSNCENCGVGFAVEKEERDVLDAEGKDTPSMCPRCRAFKDGLQDESVSCTVCGRVFIFPRELRWFARLFEWPRPRRCISGCKANAPAMTEVELQMASYLKRLRTGGRSGTMGPAGLLTTDVGMRRSLASRMETPPEGVNQEGPPQTSASLAQALKEFQDRKRRRA
jgi:hypothetical protein